MPRVFSAPFRARWIFDVELFARLVAVEPSFGAQGLEHLVYEYPFESWRDVAGSKLRPHDFIWSLAELSRHLLVLFAARLCFARGDCPIRRPRSSAGTGGSRPAARARPPSPPPKCLPSAALPGPGGFAPASIRIGPIPAEFPHFLPIAGRLGYA